MEELEDLIKYANVWKITKEEEEKIIKYYQKRKRKNQNTAYKRTTIYITNIVLSKE